MGEGSTHAMRRRNLRDRAYPPIRLHSRVGGCDLSPSEPSSFASGRLVDAAEPFRRLRERL
jgi:hypothetical protein